MTIKRTYSYPYVENRSRKDPFYGRWFGRPRNEAKTEVPKLPSTPEDLAEIIADDKACAALFGASVEDRVEWLKAYNDIVNQSDNISTQVTEQVSAVMMDWLKENGVTDRPDMSELADEITARFGPQLAGKGEVNPLYNKRALGASIDDIFNSGGEFFTAIWHNTNPSPENDAKLLRLRNAFSEKVPSEGGFLVPEILRADLLRVALENSVVRPLARVIPMDSLRVPFPTIDSTSNATSVHGGIIASWTEEGATMTDTSPTFGQLVLEAKKLTAYTEVPNELVADSISSFEVYINELFPEALADFEDRGFFFGSGAGEPLGFLNAGATIEVAKETGQAANTIVWENLVKMYSRMLPGSLGRAVWVAHQDTFPELATMALSVGTGGSAIWLNNGAVGPPMTILGRPVIFSEKAQTVGTAGDINFVDFGFYLIGDRQVMTASSSPHFKFQSDKTAFRIIERVDGRPWLESAITPVNGSTTVSPFITIAVRA